MSQDRDALAGYLAGRLEEIAVRAVEMQAELGLSRDEDGLRLSWVQSLAREIIRRPQQAASDIEMMARGADWQTAQGIAQARELAAQWQATAGQPAPELAATAAALHPMISTGATPHGTIAATGPDRQHVMLSQPGVREQLRLHGTTRSAHVLAGRLGMGAAMRAGPAAAPPPVPPVTPAQPPAAPPARRKLRRRGGGPAYGR